MSENSLALLARADQLLAEATTIQKAKELKNLALTAADWAKRKGLSESAIQHARGYALDAERRIGELLNATDLHKGGRPTEKPVAGDDQFPTPTLREIGITKDESARAQAIAALPEETFQAVRAAEKTLSSVLAEARRNERIDKIMPRLKTEKRYAVIYADPPWRYEHVRTESRAIENQYPTMALDDICGLPVREISGADAVLFLWVTAPKVAESIQVITHWEFTYRTCLVWLKNKIGMGYYCRSQHELLFVAAKGKLPVPLPENRPSSIISAARGPHSKKPIQAYEIIERMYPNLPRIELFARQKRAGWDSWGNETDGRT